MKLSCKIILYCSLIITFFHSFIPVQASATRYGGVLSNGDSLSWDTKQIKMPSVIFDKSLFKMLYSGQNSIGRWQIGLAYSLDGINWIKFISPIKSRLVYDNRDVHDPTWLFDPKTNLYEMWYASSTNSGMTDFKIYHSESVNGIDWTNENDIIVHKPELNWELDMVSCPFVLYFNNQYYMWLSGRSSGTWKIGLFTSNDGHSWTPESGNPIITKTYNLEYSQLISPEVYYDQNSNDRKFNMYYATNDLGSLSAILYAYSNDGISWSKPATENPILTKSLIPNAFDQGGVSEPSVLTTTSSILLWYGGHYLGSKGIGLAYLGSPPTPLPTPIDPLFPSLTPTETPIPPTPESTNTPTPIPPTETPTPIPPSATPIPPTLTPTPIPPTPTPTPKVPIVIIPGMFASWNKNEILEYRNDKKAKWNLLTFVHEYDGLIETLKDLGYVENENLFIWAYDWRKPISDITAQFDQYVTQTVFANPKNTSISLVGHSLGGLVARTWTQTNTNKNKVKHLITLGTPHQGVIQPYLAWEGGKTLPDNNSALSFALQIMLQLNRKTFQTNREAIRAAFPVLKDLLPSTPYLIRKADNTDITKNQMYVWNSWLETLNASAETIYPIFDAISGTGIQTPYKYIVTQPSKLDFLLGNWQDGKPENTLNEPGDGTVTANRSAFQDDASSSLNKDHGALIASAEGIKKILDTLAIDYNIGAISEGKTTQFAPGLLFLLQSPATILVTHNNQQYTDQDGILFIPNAEEGSYTATVKGTDNGIYHLSIGQFTPDKTTWSTITKSIQIDINHTYTIVFQPSNPLSVPITNMSPKDWISQIDTLLRELETITDDRKIDRLRIELALIKRMIDKENYFVVKVQLEHLLRSLSDIRHKASNDVIQKTMEIDDVISTFYLHIFTDKHLSYADHSITNLQNMLEKDIQRVNQRIDKKNNLSITQLLLFQKSMEFFEIGKTAQAKGDTLTAYLYFLRARYLLSDNSH